MKTAVFCALISTIQGEAWDDTWGDSTGFPWAALPGTSVECSRTADCTGEFEICAEVTRATNSDASCGGANPANPPCSNVDVGGFSTLAGAICVTFDYCLDGKLAMADKAGDSGWEYNYSITCGERQQQAPACDYDPTCTNKMGSVCDEGGLYCDCCARPEPVTVCAADLDCASNADTLNNALEVTCANTYINGAAQAQGTCVDPAVSCGTLDSVTQTGFDCPATAQYWERSCVTDADCAAAALITLQTTREYCAVTEQNGLPVAGNTCQSLATCEAGEPLVPVVGSVITYECEGVEGSSYYSCDDATSCSENSYCATDYTDYCECCVDSDDEGSTTCATDAECAGDASGATACGTPSLNGAPVGTGSCVNPQLCGIETTIGDQVASMSCGASKVALYAASAAVAIYMAI